MCHIFRGVRVKKVRIVEVTSKVTQSLILAPFDRTHMISHLSVFCAVFSILSQTDGNAILFQPYKAIWCERMNVRKLTFENWKHTVHT